MKRQNEVNERVNDVLGKLSALIKSQEFKKYVEGHDGLLEKGELNVQTIGDLLDEFTGREFKDKEIIDQFDTKYETYDSYIQQIILNQSAKKLDQLLENSIKNGVLSVPLEKMQELSTMDTEVYRYLIEKTDFKIQNI